MGCLSFLCFPDWLFDGPFRIARRHSSVQRASTSKKCISREKGLSAKRLISDLRRNLAFMQLVLFDHPEVRQALYPFTHTRSVGDIRCGIFTARERWEKVLRIEGSATLTENYLQATFSNPHPGEAIFVDGAVVAGEELIDAVLKLDAESALYTGDHLIALRTAELLEDVGQIVALASRLSKVSFSGAHKTLSRPWDIFSYNEWALRQDFSWLTSGRPSASLLSDVTVRGDALFVEEGAKVGAGVVINALEGPVYFGKGAEIMEGCMLRGPIALCDGATLKMGAKIYGGTTIGPGCKVGGEVSNAVFFANSNKGHDGFVGNAVIGEWCNLGADTNCSNLKNNYDAVKVWDEASGKSLSTGLTFCGLLMGDHSKCGINTMFNTGTIVGVSCNIWGGGFPQKFIPSFTWGGPEGMSTYQFDRAMETAGRMMSRRAKSLTPTERNMLQRVFERTSSSRQLLNIS